MVKEQQCIFNDLIKRNIIKYRGEFVNLSAEEENILLNISHEIRSKNNYKIILSLTENRIHLLRAILIEILYLAVDPEIEHVYFATDPYGKVFLSSMLHEMHTDNVDLKFLLLKDQSNKIKIFENAKSNPISEKDVVIFFRSNYDSLKWQKIEKGIYILTLRDLHKIAQTNEDFFIKMENNGWNHFSKISQATVNPDDLINISIYQLDGKEINRYLASIDALKLQNTKLKDYIESFGCFYMTIPIPLTWYCDYISSSNNGLNRGVIPSRLIDKNSSLGWNDCILLTGICEEMENRIADGNDKYKNTLDLLKNNLKDNKIIALVFPNIDIAEAFRWRIGSDNHTKSFSEDDISIYYPEKLFSDSLMAEKRFDTIIIPFVPSKELLCSCSNLSENIDLCLYSQEKSYLLNSIENIDQYFLERKFIFPKNFEFSLFEGPRKNFPRKPPTTKREYISPPIPANNLNDNYERFLSFLSKGDPIKIEDNPYSPRFIDNRTYNFIDEAGEIFQIHGYENIIRLNENESFTFARYRWIYPSEVKKGDILIQIPSSLRIYLYREEIEKNIRNKDSDFDILLNFLSEWKQALIDTFKRYNFIEIQRKLKENGLNREYLTICKWFDGLYEDSKVGAIAAITDPKYNIGPKNAEDIGIFADTFDIEYLKNDSKAIWAAMEVFRNNNRHIGRITMRKIIEYLETTDLIDQCQIIFVSRIEEVFRNI